EARNFLHFFLFAGDSVFRRVGESSLGERSRLQLARLVLRGCNLLLLDEPLNHLDVEGREHFEAALEAFEGTVVAVAHDRAFLRSFAERVVEVGPELPQHRAKQVIAVAGRVVIPGIVDPHAHMSGYFGADVGYRMMARVGVTTALEMAGEPDDVIAGLATAGSGLQAACMF